MLYAEMDTKTMESVPAEIQFVCPDAMQHIEARREHCIPYLIGVQLMWQD